MTNDKQKALDTVLAQIEKNYGKGAIMKLGSNVTQTVEVIPSGCLALDVAM
ncbi:MAG TPA: DNA recombination/repair protein RecA, partial [Clostridiales bacterium]|nr:DNA recombination/repair protein RecA [Clostridiales bacterium]